MTREVGAAQRTSMQVEGGGVLRHSYGAGERSEDAVEPGVADEYPPQRERSGHAETGDEERFELGGEVDWAEGEGETDEDGSLEDVRGECAASEGAAATGRRVVEMPLRGAKHPHRCPDYERALDCRKPDRRPVQSQVGEGIARVEAGGNDRQDEGEDGKRSSRRCGTGPAPDLSGDIVKAAALGGDDAQAENRQVLRPLPEREFADLVASPGKHEAIVVSEMPPASTTSVRPDRAPADPYCDTGGASAGVIHASRRSRASRSTGPRRTTSAPGRERVGVHKPRPGQSVV